MKNTLIALFTILFFCSFLRTDTGNLSVTIPEIKDPGVGRLVIVLHSEKATFPGQRAAAFRNIVLEKFGSSQTVIFEDIPYGVYAVSIHHDKDSNGKLNLNFFGIPVEPVGVSNMNSIGYPRFSKSKFGLYESLKEIKVVFLID